MWVRARKKNEKSNQFHSYTLTHYLWMQYFFPVQYAAFFAFLCVCVFSRISNTLYFKPFRMQHMCVHIIFVLFIFFSASSRIHFPYHHLRTVKKETFTEEKDVEGIFVSIYLLLLRLFLLFCVAVVVAILQLSWMYFLLKKSDRVYWNVIIHESRGKNNDTPWQRAQKSEIK